MNALDPRPASGTPTDLLYRLDDRPKPWIAFLAALQHLLAIIVPIVTPGLLICQAIGVSPRDTNIIVSMSLVISGIATFLQCKRFGPLGAGLLIVQGTSFNFVGPLIGGGVLLVKQGTPVEGVLAAIVVLNRVPVVWMRSCAIIIALAIGYALAAYLGRLNFAGMHEAALFQVPMPLHFGLGFSWSLFIPMVVIYLVTSLEAIGDITATSKISGQPVEGPVWMQRIKGGVLVNGANSLLAGLFNTFPSSVFAQNNGIIQLTGIASRYVGLWIAAMLVVLGLFPAVAGVLQAVPEPVLGGAALVMFGAVAAAGINIIAGVRLDRRALLIISVSLALGLGVSQVPEFLANLPAALRNVLESGVATGGICALLMNWFLPESPLNEEREPV